MLKKARDFLRLRHAKQYDEGKRKNPFSLKVPPRRWMIIISIILGTISLGTASVALSYYPGFRMSGVEIQGATTVTSTEIERAFQEALEEFSYPMIAHNNAYIFPRQNIEENFTERFSLESVKISRMGTKISIVIKEKVIQVALRNKEKTVFLNLDGSYLRDASPEESHALDVRLNIVEIKPDEALALLQPDMPIIFNHGTDAAISLPTAYLEQILALARALPLQGFQVVAFLLEGSTAPWVRIDTNQSYDLLCDLTKDVNHQLRALQSVMSAPNFIAPKEYIDLRFGAYIYFK